LRERLFSGSNLQLLKERILSLNARTVICVSHRPAFWVSNLKRRERMDFKLWGVLGEYGNTLGWKYIFWDQIDGFLSPLDRGVLNYNFSEHLEFLKIALPARRIFYETANSPGDKNSVLLVCGFWGQGPILHILPELLRVDCELRVHAVCGENASLLDTIRYTFRDYPTVETYGVVESLAPLLRACACVITKPGISTLLEAQAARRKIFLLKGMPVAEDNNARYAVKHFGAEWFSLERFRRWHAGQVMTTGLGAPPGY
jgi:hypothetical protein